MPVLPAIEGRWVGGVVEDSDQMGGWRIRTIAKPQAVVVADILVDAVRVVEIGMPRGRVHAVVERQVLAVGLRIERRDLRSYRVKPVCGDGVIGKRRADGLSAGSRGCQ